MVRKRSRASRKYNSSDENDTESDYSVDDSPEEPAPKKYSLRQRKKTVFIEDFDYEDAEEDLSANDDDDEDFEFEEETGHSETSSRNEEVSNEYESPSIQYESPSIPVDPAADLPDNPDELIDFEDVIRADIVVNKNRIDYDNLISKSEIKVQPFSEAIPVKTRRGRKPKERPETEIDSSLLEPETEVTEEYSDCNDDDDYVPDNFLVNVALECVQTELQENNENGKDKGSCIREQQSPQQPDSTFVDNHNNIPSTEDDVSPISPATSQESVIKVNPLQVNGKSFHIENPEIHLELKQESEDDDDDVVLIEDKNCEVIVLDD